MKAEKAWHATVGQLQMEMPKAAFDTWVRNSEFISYEDGSFIIGVQNAYARDWLESRLASTVTRLLIGIMNRTVEVRFVVWQITHEEAKSDLRGDNNAVETQGELQQDRPTNTCLNPRYSFDNFVVGTSNRLAHAAY